MTSIYEKYPRNIFAAKNPEGDLAADSAASIRAVQGDLAQNSAAGGDPLRCQVAVRAPDIFRCCRAATVPATAWRPHQQGPRLVSPYRGGPVRRCPQEHRIARGRAANQPTSQPATPRKCRRSVKLSQPWGQRNAYEPQKGIEVDALGALSAVPISASAW